MDILEEIDRWVIKHGKDNYEIFDGRNRFENYFKTKLKTWGVEDVYFSDTPERI